ELLHIDDHQRISIVACPEIPAKVLQCALAAHENDLPPSPLVKPSPSQHVMDIANALLYDAGSSSSSSTEAHGAYSFQVRFSDMSECLMKQLVATAQTLNLSLRCDPEFIHHSDLYPD